MICLKPYALLVPLWLFVINASAQTQSNTLYTAGHASAFIGGLYDAVYPYTNVLKHGNFGLGAPDKLDGEILILDSKIYQTQATGKTFEVKRTELTPFTVVNFFKAQKTAKTTLKLPKNHLFKYLDSILTNKNGIYAIKITGSFGLIKTRAFPPVARPYVPLADMLPLQHFFTFNNIRGTLVGYRIPAFMDGPNITGYHFHFLSDDKKAGGHIIELLTDNITIGIDEMDSFLVDIPQTEEFNNFDFKKDRREEVKRVENGKKE
ncbi:acetolactate decarboxylase [Mucilaginibacter phyllosphaerae]|uniref:Alpha-acetolactate decarboxylase n=1 Tax=Mucilaginibacter phyllosphaerae TaxID=1812349 RepID=A0A4Y8A5Q5_9SPHI|nr:acetolactate decarboxylase [Mucilaginibacter phyllosphaerae]MBB3971006.1 acetolactate decarboxylase [Mucilaginibacter phyllosphaerae]TEW63750.1 acetolactate decarboxylase [Mucilaginibacter phyllosphaerae]GGH21916.1 alpha-acetolactate decarboxylase [Mucilaginibacter phyllosphaerae]